MIPHQLFPYQLAPWCKCESPSSGNTFYKKKKKNPQKPRGAGSKPDFGRFTVRSLIQEPAIKPRRRGWVRPPRPSAGCWQASDSGFSNLFVWLNVQKDVRIKIEMGIDRTISENKRGGGGRLYNSVCLARLHLGLAPLTVLFQFDPAWGSLWERFPIRGRWHRTPLQLIMFQIKISHTHTLSRIAAPTPQVLSFFLNKSL